MESTQWTLPLLSLGAPPPPGLALGETEAW